MNDLTCDDFLGGRIRLWQPKTGYRAGIDPVLLASAIPAKPGQTILELGIGTGAAALCLAKRIPETDITGIEIQPKHAEICRQNIAENRESINVIQADLRKLPDHLKQRNFDHVMMNPPYFESHATTESKDFARDIAFRGETLLTDWLDCGLRRLTPGGTLTMIQRTERLPEVLTFLNDKVCTTKVLPIAARTNRPSKFFLLNTRKASKGKFELMAALIIHQGLKHNENTKEYSVKVNNILMNGQALGCFE